MSIVLVLTTRQQQQHTAYHPVVCLRIVLLVYSFFALLHVVFHGIVAYLS